MKNTFWKRERIEIMIALALFNYVFLGAEYLFDNMMAFQTDSGGVVLVPEFLAAACLWGDPGTSELWKHTCSRTDFICGCLE